MTRPCSSGRFRCSPAASGSLSLDSPRLEGRLGGAAQAGRVRPVRTSLKGGGKGKSLADAAEKASDDAKALPDLSREQGEYLDVVTNEWGAQGAERKKLRDAMAAVQKNLERANANLTKAAKAATPSGANSSDVLEKATRIDAAVTEAGDRLRARWQLEQATREREAKQREREAAERARGGK